MSSFLNLSAFFTVGVISLGESFLISLFCWEMLDFWGVLSDFLRDDSYLVGYIYVNERLCHEFLVLDGDFFDDLDVSLWKGLHDM